MATNNINNTPIEITTIDPGKPTGIDGIPVSITTGYGSTKYQAFQQGFSSVTPRRFDIDSYKKLFDNVNTNLPQITLDEERARAQSVGRLIGNSAIQLGGTLVGDIISGVGSILNFGNVTYEQLKSIIDTDYNPDWNDIMNNGVGAALSKIGTSISEGSRDLAPIYTTQRAQEGGFGGGFGDATWWASNFPTIGSAISSMIPILGQMRLLNWAGKAASAVKGVNTFGKIANVTGKVLTDKKVQAAVGTVYGAHLDSMMEIVHDYDNQLQYAKSLGLNDEEAVKFASTYASEAYKDAWAYGIIFNAIELNAILKGTNKLSKTISGVDTSVRKAIPEMAKKGMAYTGISDDVLNVSKKTILRSTLNKGWDYLKVLVSEGLEEMRVDIALNEGQLAAKREFGIYDPRNELTFFNRVKQYVSDSRNWDSFLWGMAGGVTMYGARDILAKINMPDSYKDYNKNLYTNIMNTLQDTINVIGTYDGDLSMRTDLNEDPAVTVFAPLFNKLGAANAIIYADNLLSELSNYTPQELTEIYGSDKTNLINTLRQEFTIAKDIYNKNRRVNWNTPYNDFIQNELAGIDYLKDYYNRKLNAIETEILRVKTLYNDLDVQRDNKLKEIDSQIYELNNRKQNLEDIINSNIENNINIDKFLNDSKIIKEVEDLKSNKSELQKTIKNLKARINRQQTNKDYIISEINRLSNLIANTTEEDKRRDYIQNLNKLRQSNKSRRVENSNLSNDLYIAQQDLNHINTLISYYKGEYSTQNKKKLINEKAIKNAEKEIANIDKELNKYKESRSDVIAEYNSTKAEYDAIPREHNMTLENLNKVRKSVFANLNQYSNIANNRVEYAENIKTAVEPLINLEIEELNNKESKIKFDEQIDNENIIEDTEISNKPSSIQTIINDNQIITYTSTENGTINSFIIKGKKYDVGSTVKTEGRTLTINSISNDNGVINVSTNEGIISAINLDIIATTDSRNSSTSDIYSIGDTFVEANFKKNYVESIERLYKVIKTKKFKNAFETKTSNLDIAILRNRTIENLLTYINKYEPTNLIDIVDNNFDNFKNTVINNLNGIFTQSQNDIETIMTKEYLYDKFTIISPTKSSEINNQLNNDYINKFVDNIASYIQRIGFIDFTDDTFRFKEGVNIDEINNTIQKYIDDFISTITNKFYTQYALQDFSDINTIIQDKINTFKDKLIKDYDKQQSRIKSIIEQEQSEIVDETSSQDILFSIKRFAESFDNNETIDKEESSYKRDDYQYYITPSEQEAFNAINDIISKWKLNNRLNPNKKISYTDIINIIYNTPDGINQVESLYKPIWRALKNVSDFDRISELKATIKENVPKDKYQSFFDILDNIIYNVIPPIRSIESKYVDANDNIKSTFIKDYKNTHTQNIVEYGTREGTMINGNNIYDAIQKSYDSKYRKVNGIITIGDYTYTPNELIDAYKNLKKGESINYKLSEDGNTINLFIDINGKPTPIGNLSLDQHLTMGNLSLVRPLNDSGDTFTWDNFLGSSEGLKPALTGFLQSIAKSERGFDLIRNYFKTYREAITDGTTKNNTIETKLSSIINDLNTIGKISKSGHSNIVNALLYLSNYNSERENTDEINYEAIYNVIQPIFYGRWEIIDSINNNYLDLKNIYESLNSRLHERYNQTEAIRNAIINNPNSNIIISSINKAPVSFDNNRNAQNNINENVKGEVELNGKLVPNIIIKQPYKRSDVVSSVTTNSRIDNPEARRVIYNNNRSTNFYTEIRLNGEENGMSYIRLNLNSLNGDSDYSRVAIEFIRDGFSKIIKDKFLTNLTTISSNNNIVTVSEPVKNHYNNEFSKLLNDMSEAIIINNEDSNKIPWFDVSNIYDNQSRNNMAKDIKILTNDGDRTWGYNIRTNYKYDRNPDNSSEITSIEISRFYSKEYRLKGDNSQAFTKTQLYKAGFIEENDRENLNTSKITYKINPNNKAIILNVKNQDDVNKIINSDLFTKIISNAQRNIKTTFNNGSYTYSSNATGESFGASYNNIDNSNIIVGTEGGKIFKNNYTSVILEWGKQKGIYNGKTTFDTIQDFYLDTKGLYTNLIPIRNDIDNSIVTNYRVDADIPRIYVKLDNPNSETEQIKPVNQTREERLNIATSIVKNISSSEFNSIDNYYKNLSETKGLTRQTFNEIGFLKRSDSEESFNILKQFLDEAIPFNESLPIIIFNSAEEYIDAARKYRNSTESDEDLTEEFNSIEGIYFPKNKVIGLNSEIFTTNSQNIGTTILHETLHHRIRKAIINKEITEDNARYINGIVEDLVNQSNNLIYKIPTEQRDYLSEFLKDIAYDENGNIIENLAYDELLANMLSNRRIAEVLNNIYYKDSNSKPGKSIWGTIIEILMKVFGITINNSSVLQEIQNAFNPSMIVVDSVTIEKQATDATSSPISAPQALPIEFDDIDITTIDDSFIINNDDGLFSRKEIGLLADREGHGQSLVENNVLNSVDNQNKLVSLSSDVSTLDSFKDTFTDSDNLKIC